MKPKQAVAIAERLATRPEFDSSTLAPMIADSTATLRSGSSARWKHRCLRSAATSWL